MKIDIPIIKLFMSFVKKNSPKSSAKWSEIAKYSVILAIQIFGFLSMLAGFAWVIKYF